MNNIKNRILAMVVAIGISGCSRPECRCDEGYMPPPQQDFFPKSSFFSYGDINEVQLKDSLYGFYVSYICGANPDSIPGPEYHRYIEDLRRGVVVDFPVKQLSVSENCFGENLVLYSSLFLKPDSVYNVQIDTLGLYYDRECQIAYEIHDDSYYVHPFYPHPSRKKANVLREHAILYQCKREKVKVAIYMGLSFYSMDRNSRHIRDKAFYNLMDAEVIIPQMMLQDDSVVTNKSVLPDRLSEL